MATEKWQETNRGTELFDRSVFQTLSFAYSPFRWKIAVITVLGLTGRGLLLANTNLVGAWVDGRIPFPAAKFLLLLSAMATVGFVLTLTFRILFSRLSAKAVSQIYDEVTVRTSRYPMSFFDQTPAGRVITRFSSDYGNVFRLFGGPLAEFFSILFDLTMMLILMGVASPYFLISIGIIGAFNYFVYRANRDRLRVLRRELSASRSPSIAHFAESTQGVSTVRAFRKEKSFSSRFLLLDQHYLDKKLKTSSGLLSFSFQMNSLSALLLLITGIASIFLVRAGMVSVGSVGVAFAFIVMSGNTLQMFFEWLAQLEEALVGVERLDRYLRLPIEEGNRIPSTATFPTGHAQLSPEQEKSRQSARLTTSPSAAVEIQDLWFRYAENLPWVLKGIHLSIAPGEKIGIVGRTGSGKSSLIQALFRLYPLQKGRVLIDGQEARTSTAEGSDLLLYRRSMAFIAQDPVLFQGPLRDNLDIDRRRTTEECFAALDRVGLGDWVRQHPDGLNLRVEERGKNLSLGERQLICMARCLLQEAPVVIMDEATSAVDPQSEEILVRATEEFFEGRTQILIAHRLSTLRTCDRILWLENGEVRMLGPRDIVLADFS